MGYKVYNAIYRIITDLHNMKTPTIIFSLFLSMAACAALPACTPTEATRGNIVEDYRMAEITPGVSSRTNVLQSLGSPTTVAPFDDKVWYYIGQKTEKTGIFDPKVVDKKIVVVTFNDDGIVQTMDNVNANDVDVPKVRDKTPTSGNEVTVLQQFLGNIGRFNSDSKDKPQDVGGGSRSD